MTRFLSVFATVTLVNSSAFAELVMGGPSDRVSNEQAICTNSDGVWAGQNPTGKQCACFAAGLIHSSDPQCKNLSKEKSGDRCVQQTDCLSTFCNKDQKPALVVAQARKPQKKITSQCRNGRDDDGDGWVDLLDPGCESRDDKTEKNDPDSGYECSDGKDNDSDGFIDGFDRDCEYPKDTSETPDPPCPPRVDCPACPEPATKFVTVKEAFTVLFHAWHPYVMGTGVGFGGEKNAPFALGPGFGLLFEVDNDWEAYFDGSYVYAFNGDGGGHSVLFRGGVNWYFSDNLGATVGADSYHVGINSVAFTGPGNTDILMRAGHVGLEARFFGHKLRPWVGYMIGGASPGQFVAHGAQAGLRFHWW